MSKLKIYHNPKCSKSRKTMELLVENNIKPEVILYLEQGLTEQEIMELASKLQMDVKEFVRVKEEEFKSLKIDWSNNLTAAKALVSCPKLLERPIVVSDKKAVIGRPPEEVLKLIL